MRIHNNKKGFSLLEVIFALAILIIGIVGVLAFFPVGLKASKRSGDFTVATFLAQQQMDSIKMARWSVYGTNNGWYNYRGYSFNYVGESPFPNNPNFSWVAYVQDLSPTVANLKKVTLSIYWLDGGSQDSEDFITYLTNYQ